MVEIFFFFKDHWGKNGKNTSYNTKKEHHLHKVVVYSQLYPKKLKSVINFFLKMVS